MLFVKDDEVVIKKKYLERLYEGFENSIDEKFYKSVEEHFEADRRFIRFLKRHKLIRNKDVKKKYASIREKKKSIKKFAIENYGKTLYIENNYFKYSCLIVEKLNVFIEVKIIGFNKVKNSPYYELILLINGEKFKYRESIELLKSQIDKESFIYDDKYKIWATKETHIQIAKALKLFLNKSDSLAGSFDDFEKALKDLETLPFKK